MRLLQLHEYVALLDGGTDKHPIGDDVSKACLSQAESIWPQLRMSSWTDRPRTIEYVARCRVTGRLLVHVSSDWKDCFLILVVPPHHLPPHHLPPHHLETEGYLLFDIGAEYREARLVCPAFGLDHVANESEIRGTIPLLPGASDPFAILETGEGTYMQTYAEGGMFDVEHQLVSLASHYRLTRRVSAEVVVSLFLSYAFGRKEWASEYVWEKMEL
jgi:hypothetical protein